MSSVPLHRWDYEALHNEICNTSEKELLQKIAFKLLQENEKLYEKNKRQSTALNQIHILIQELYRKIQTKMAEAIMLRKCLALSQHNRAEFLTDFVKFVDSNTGYSLLEMILKDTEDPNYCLLAQLNYSVTCSLMIMRFLLTHLVDAGNDEESKMKHMKDILTAVTGQVQFAVQVHGSLEGAFGKSSSKDGGSNENSRRKRSRSSFPNSSQTKKRKTEEQKKQFLFDFAKHSNKKDRVKVTHNKKRRNDESRNLETSKSRNLENSKSGNVETSKSRNRGTSKSRNLETSKSRNLETSKSRNLETSKSRKPETSKSKKMETSKSKNVESTDTISESVHNSDSASMNPYDISNLFVQLIDVLNDPAAECDPDVARYKEINIYKDIEDDEYEIVDDVDSSSEEEDEASDIDESEMKNETSIEPKSCSSQSKLKDDDGDDNSANSDVYQEEDTQESASDGSHDGDDKGANDEESNDDEAQGYSESKPYKGKGPRTPPHEPYFRRGPRTPPHEPYFRRGPRTPPIPYPGVSSDSDDSNG